MFEHDVADLRVQLRVLLNRSRYIEDSPMLVNQLWLHLMPHLFLIETELFLKTQEM